MVCSNAFLNPLDRQRRTPLEVVGYEQPDVTAGLQVPEHDGQPVQILVPRWRAAVGSLRLRLHASRAHQTGHGLEVFVESHAHEIVVAAALDACTGVFPNNLLMATARIIMMPMETQRAGR